MAGKDQKKGRVLFVVPLPPPFAGPEMASAILLNSSLKEKFDILHLKSNIHDENSQRGHVSLRSIWRLMVLCAKLKGIIITRWPFCVYTIINQNVTGFIRDSFYVLISKMFGRKVVLHFRGSNFEYFYNQQSNLFKNYIRFVLNRADKIILQSNWVKEKFSKFVPEEKLTVIYNAVDNTILKQSQTLSKHEGVHVLFMNHLSVAKGVIEFLKAAEEIVQEREDVRFEVAGDVINEEKNILFGEDGQKVQFQDVFQAIEQTKGRGNGRIGFPGLIETEEERLQKYSEADIFVLPSYSEGCPMSVLEAMAMGLPVVVTPVGALKDIIKDQENGCFVPIGDASTLKQKMLQLADDGKLRDSMSRRNQNLIRKDFNIETISNQIADVFRNL